MWHIFLLSICYNFPVIHCVCIYRSWSWEIMGCIISTSKDERGTMKKLWKDGEMFIFISGLCIPKRIDFDKSIQGYMSTKMLEHLSALRTWIVSMEAGRVLLPKIGERKQHNMVTLIHYFSLEKLILYCEIMSVQRGTHFCKT